MLRFVKTTPPLVRRVYHDDLFEVLPTFEPDSLDVCVTDPPYGLEFMGKQWDTYRDQTFHRCWAKFVFRVLKPGAYLVAFGGTRTYHRMTCGIEEAGFEIRDCLMWLYGTGFPKSLNVGEGRGTALKPGWEPIILARKPLRGTVAENVQQYGTGALNIDGCRIAGVVEPTRFDPAKHTHEGWRMAATGAETAARAETAGGRWPANVILDEEAAVQLDAQTGDLGVSAGGRNANISTTSIIYGGGKGLGQALAPEAVRGDPGYGDSGGPSRFFYCAKPSRAERDMGCDSLPPQTSPETVNREVDSAGVQNPRAGAGRGAGVPRYRCSVCDLHLGGGRAATLCTDGKAHTPVLIGEGEKVLNGHPTVKPLALMRWLVKLVTPPGGIVLDPFLGSGTTAMACVKEGVGYVGVERQAEYVEIAKCRIAACE